MRWLCSLLAISAAACTAAQEARPDAGAQPTADSAATARIETPKTAAPSTRVDTPRTAAPPMTATPRASAPASVTSGGSDTVPPRLIAGRAKHDSLGLAWTVAFGRRMMAKWPAMANPLPGSILPGRRIVAFYGNPLARKMGVLGEYGVDTMLAKLDTIVREWEAADPSTPVQPALHLIAVVAQGSPGRDGTYRLRMDTALIEKVYGWAQQKHALLFLDVQIGLSTMQRELPRLMPFLSRPDVHLGMDPEFSMHHGAEGVPPGKRIGQYDASDI